MSAVRPYYLLGQQQLDRLAEQLRAALPPLAKRWWPTDVELQVVGISNFYGDAGLLGKTARYFARHDERWVALLGSERSWLTLAEGWLGCKVAMASELVQTLMRAFCVDVFTTLADNSIEPTLCADLPWSQLPIEILQPGAGTLLLEIIVDDSALQLLVSAALWPSLAAQPGVRAQKKLISCHTALGASRVHANVSLPIAQIPLTDIAILAVGDFLNLGHNLSGRVQLQGKDIALSLPAIVGRNEGHKAIKLSALHNEKIA